LNGVLAQAWNFPLSKRTARANWAEQVFLEARARTEDKKVTLECFCDARSESGKSS